MRWRLIDRITAFAPRQHITGVAVVSLESYLLPECLGRDGVLPESLLFGAWCELAHWWHGASSNWRDSADCTAIDDFRIVHPALAGEVLTIALVAQNDGNVRADIQGDRHCHAEALLTFTTIPLDKRCNPALVAEDWTVLRGPTA
jgi:hypothetical protein